MTLFSDPTANKYHSGSGGATSTKPNGGFDSPALETIFSSSKRNFTPEEKKILGVGALAGITIGVLALIGCIGFVWLVRRRRRTRHTQDGRVHGAESPSYGKKRELPVQPFIPERPIYGQPTLEVYQHVAELPTARVYEKPVDERS